MESYLGAHRHDERRQRNNAWVGVRFDRLWASHLRCDSAGKITKAGDDRLSRLSIIPIRSWVEGAGLSAPVLHEGTVGAQSSVNSCRVLRPLFRVLTFISPRFTDLLCEVPRFHVVFCASNGN